MDSSPTHRSRAELSDVDRRRSARGSGRARLFEPFIRAWHGLQERPRLAFLLAGVLLPNAVFLALQVGGVVPVMRGIAIAAYAAFAFFSPLLPAWCIPPLFVLLVLMDIGWTMVQMFAVGLPELLSAISLIGLLEPSASGFYAGTALALALTSAACILILVRMRETMRSAAKTRAPWPPRWH